MSTDTLADLTPANPLLLNGDCLQLMKTLPDKSVDLFICDLPYGETTCSWDTRIDLSEFWVQFKRLRKSKRVACIHFCSTGFGYTLIKSWEKGFKMDMVWKKRNKTGGLQSRHRPMRNHEMVYFFYEQAPKYNRDKYHKRVKSVPMSVSEHQGGLPEQETKWRVKDIGLNASFEPKQPASVLEQDEVQRTIYGGTKADPGWWAHNSFKGNENPSSVLEEQDDRVDPITKKTGHGWEVEYMDKQRIPHFDPALPPSVLEEDNSLDCYEEGAPVSMFESTKCFFGKRNHQTEKPQDILEFFLKYWTDPGDVVLDPTFGGGSTGEACMRMGRKFIGCELDDKYYREGSARITATLPDPGKSV
jgi:DNA modification methylase